MVPPQSHVGPEARTALQFGYPSLDPFRFLFRSTWQTGAQTRMTSCFPPAAASLITSAGRPVDQSEGERGELGKMIRAFHTRARHFKSAVSTFPVGRAFPSTHMHDHRPSFCLSASSSSFVCMYVRVCVRARVRGGLGVGVPLRIRTETRNSLIIS